MEHVSTDKNKNMIQNICNKNEGVSLYAMRLLFSLTIKIGSFFKLRYFIIRKSKFPQNPKRSVRFSGKRTKRSVQKRKARNTQKAETKVL